MGISTLPLMKGNVAASHSPRLRRAWPRALWRGVRGRCPACGEGRLFGQRLQVEHACAHCGEELYHHRARRLVLPLATFVALQVVLLAALLLRFSGLVLPLWAWGAGWIVLLLLLLRPVKGGIIGVQWALRLHGFQYAAMCRPHRR